MRLCATANAQCKLNFYPGPPPERANATPATAYHIPKRAGGRNTDFAVPEAILSVLPARTPPSWYIQCSADLPRDGYEKILRYPRRGQADQHYVESPPTNDRQNHCDASSVSQTMVAGLQDPEL